MQVVLHSEIVDGAVDHYLAEHERIPDDLVATFARIGIRDWTIWRSGHRLFHLVDCDDWDAAVLALADDPADRAWQQTIGEYVALFRDTDGAEGVAPLAQVWRLAEQHADGVTPGQHGDDA